MTKLTDMNIDIANESLEEAANLYHKLSRAGFNQPTLVEQIDAVLAKIQTLENVIELGI